MIIRLSNLQVSAHSPSSVRGSPGTPRTPGTPGTPLSAASVAAAAADAAAAAAAAAALQPRPAATPPYTPGNHPAAAPATAPAAAPAPADVISPRRSPRKHVTPGSSTSNKGKGAARQLLTGPSSLPKRHPSTVGLQDLSGYGEESAEDSVEEFDETL